MRYTVDHGIDSTVEFKGLTAQYLFIFVGGLFIDFIFIVALTMTGIDTIVSVIIGIVIASAVVFYCFRMNKIYGRYGLMKKLCYGTRPKYIKVNKSVTKLLK